MHAEIIAPRRPALWTAPKPFIRRGRAGAFTKPPVYADAKIEAMPGRVGLLGAGRRAASAPPATFESEVIALLGAKNRAFWLYDEPAYLWQNTDGTGAVSADTDPVGRVDDLSGNGKHLLQATAGNRPAYRTGPARLVFDGVNDALVVASAAFPTDEFETFVVVETTSTPANDKWLWAMGPASGHTFGGGPGVSFGDSNAIVEFMANSASMRCFQSGTGGAALALYEFSKTASTSALNINGSAISTDNSFTSTTTPHTGPFVFGAAVNNGNPNSGNFSPIAGRLMIIAAGLTSGERSDLRDLINARYSLW